MATRRAAKKTAKKASKASKKVAKKTSKKVAKVAKKVAKVAKKVAKVAKVAAAKKKAIARPAPAPAPAPAAKAAKPLKPVKAPVLWKFETATSALGIYVDKNLAWIGNENGDIFAMKHDGEIVHQFKLPDGCKAIIADEHWRYAGCNNGNVYDLSGRVPRVVYEVGKNKQILWMDIFRGNLCVSNGGVVVVDAEDNLKWKQKKPGGWMVRADASGVYNGGSSIVKFDWDGKKQWETKVSTLLFGWQEQDAVYGGTVDDHVIALSKDSGKILAKGKCDDSVTSNAASPDGKFMFGGGDHITCLDAKTGEQKWVLDPGLGMALSMQYLDEKLYIVTGDGVLACIDVSDAAIKKATAGQKIKVETRKAPKIEAVSTKLEKVTDAGGGVVVECVKEGSKLRVRVLSDGYHKDWFCQFPKDIREAGARYVVDKVLEASQGGFYRVLGDIKRLG